MIKKVSLAGIITGLLYFIAVAIFLITKAETHLIC